MATLHGLQPDFLQDYTLFAAHLDAVICSNRLAQALVRERCTLTSDRVTFLGVLDAAALRDRLYRRCDVLLLTSSWETGPIVAREALGEGMAMLSSDYLVRRTEGSLHDNENCLLFAVGDIDGAVNGIAKLTDPQLRARLAIAGRALVEHRDSHAQSVGIWLDRLRTVHQAPALAHAPLPPVDISGRSTVHSAHAGANAFGNCLDAAIGTWSPAANGHTRAAT